MRREVEGALAKAGVLVVPVLVGGAHMPQGKDLPQSLERLAYREAFELRDNRWGRDVGDLVSYLGRVSGVGDSRKRTGSLRSIAAGAVLSLVLVVVAAIFVLQLLRSDDPKRDADGDTASSGPSCAPVEPDSIAFRVRDNCDADRIDSERWACPTRAARHLHGHQRRGVQRHDAHLARCRGL